MGAAAAELLRGRERLVEVTAHLEHPGAEHPRLGDLRAGDRTCGVSTTAGMPARAAYAAADAAVFPVEAQITASAPSSTAFETATVMPRSL